MCGPRQLFLFQCGTEVSMGCMPLVEDDGCRSSETKTLLMQLGSRWSPDGTQDLCDPLGSSGREGVCVGDKKAGVASHTGSRSLRILLS